MRAALFAVVLLLPAGCGATPVRSDGHLDVVAAEGFWGSVAAQLGGPHVQVTSVLDGAGADPHEYEPTAADARRVADARVAVVNGADYDPWAKQLLRAGATGPRAVVDAGELAGAGAGDNPHLWYDPATVDRVAGALTAAYVAADPAHAAAYAQLHHRFEQTALRRYHRELAAIRSRYAGIQVGASESIAEPLARALGLRLVTPGAFLRAVSEGAEPAAGDRAAVERQLRRHEVRAWLWNTQNATPDVRRLTALARREGIPVVALTETPSPPSARFQDWQVRQLAALRRALGATR